MTDSLKIVLADRIIKVINDSTDKIVGSDDDGFNSSVITVIGMLLVAIITVLSQYLITKKTIKADFLKIQSQIEADFNSKNRLDWISNLRTIVAELITTTDPDYNEKLDKLKMCSLINQAQIMLNDSIPDEKTLGGAITQLGLLSDYWNTNDTQAKINILKAQDEVLKQTKILLHKKQFS